MFSQADLEQLRSHGISEADAARQLSFFKNPPAPARLQRPCMNGDGILRLDAAQQAQAEAAGAALLQAGRVGKFVPASGAATRMFQALQAEPQGKAAQEVLAKLEHFAFAHELEGQADALSLILERYSSLPKALLQFHWYRDHSHTAFEEHLREAEALGIRSLHFTVSPEHRQGFESLLKILKMPLDASFSEQKPSTDTLAADGQGAPFRGKDGKLVFRPGGHGALLENLNDLGADVVLIKNIDNITHSRLWPEQLRWKRILLGVLAAQSVSDRPTRVCGVVKNTGEPGGGPFFVQRAAGNAGQDAAHAAAQGGMRGGMQDRRQEGRVDAQIVESAQVNMKEPEQKRIFDAATHFNPVDLACAVKGFDLRRFRDDRAVFISQKSKDGKPLQALELPGLWNGAMADWHTVFVEVPLETFNPVKTINDLLKPAHQPA
jgi:hypothetical protein